MTDSASIFGSRSPRNSRTSRRRGVQVIAALGVSAITLVGCSQADEGDETA